MDAARPNGLDLGLLLMGLKSSRREGNGLLVERARPDEFGRPYGSVREAFWALGLQSVLVGRLSNVGKIILVLLLSKEN